MTANFAAETGAEAVGAGDPQARTGDEHVVRVSPRHAVDGLAAGVDLHHPVAGRVILQALVRYCVRTGLVATVRVVAPARMPGGVNGTSVRCDRVQRVAPCVVDPRVGNRGLSSWPGGYRVAQPGTRERAGCLVPRVETVFDGVDRRVVRRPGGGVHVERLSEPALVGVAAGQVPLAAVPFRRGPPGDRRRFGRQVQHEDLLPGLAAYRGEDALGKVQRATVAELLVVDLGREGYRALAGAGIAVEVVPGEVEI